MNFFHKRVWRLKGCKTLLVTMTPTSCKRRSRGPLAMLCRLHILCAFISVLACSNTPLLCLPLSPRPSYAKSSGRLWFARLSPPSSRVTYYGSLQAESVSLRGKLCVVQLVESGTKLSFRFSCEAQSTRRARKKKKETSQTKPLTDF